MTRRAPLSTSIDPAVLHRLDEWSEYLLMGRGKLVEVAIIRLCDALDEADPDPRVLVTA